MNEENEESKIYAEFVNTISNQNARNRDDNEALNYFTTESVNPKETNTTFMIDEVIAETISKISEIDASKGIQIVFETNSSSIVYARRDMIRCMARNLIFNVVKYGANGEIVTIFSKSVRDKVVVYITSSKSKTSGDVFNRLLQENAEKTDFSKSEIDEIITRIELLLCRQFAEQSDGNLLIEFGENQDTVFSFSLRKGSIDRPLDRVKFFLPIDSVIHWHSGF